VRNFSFQPRLGDAGAVGDVDIVVVVNNDGETDGAEIDPTGRDELEFCRDVTS
jgi:hypothetical protein